jgi:hypothetical protein
VRLADDRQHDRRSAGIGLPLVVLGVAVADLDALGAA